jgi:hypothetical protein
VPSSVTIIGEPDGRFYAVVQRLPTPLPPVKRTTGIDLGLTWFAVVAASDGTVEQVANLRHLRAAQRRLARAQRRLSRKQTGSVNRALARVRVAVAHRKVRDRRADHHHKLALRLLRENKRSPSRIWLWPGWPVPAWPRACMTPAGRPVSACWRQGRPARAPAGQGRPLDTDLADLLGLWGTGTAPSRSGSVPGPVGPVGGRP